MRKRPSTPRGSAGKPLRLSKPEIAAAAALARFRPKKSQVRSFVHIGLNGKPLPKGSTRKGVMVYVWEGRRPKKGKGSRSPAPIRFKPIRERGKRRVTPRRSGSYDLAGKGSKTAFKKFYEKKKTHKSREKTLRVSPREKRSGVNYLRFSKSLGRDLRAFIDSFRSRGTVLIDISFTVRFPSGELETHNATVSFSQSELQHLRPRDYEKFIQTKVYRFIAEQLSRHDLVTAGSASHIRSLSANRGLDRSDWVNRKGEAWDKADFQTVRIVQMSYQLSRVSK